MGDHLSTVTSNPQDHVAQHTICMQPISPFLPALPAYRICINTIDAVYIYQVSHVSIDTLIRRYTSTGERQQKQELSHPDMQTAAGQSIFRSID